MTDFKITVSDNKGQSQTKELKDSDANILVGLLIGQQTDGSIIGLKGKLKITGGSDKSGIPMRSDFFGGGRKYILLSKGVGLQKAEKGQRIRKLMRGNTISEEIYQINCRYDGIIPSEKLSNEKEEPTNNDNKEETKA